MTILLAPLNKNGLQHKDGGNGDEGLSCAADFVVVEHVTES